MKKAHSLAVTVGALALTLGVTTAPASADPPPRGQAGYGQDADAQDAAGQGNAQNTGGQTTTGGQTAGGGQAM